jgi:hypothetical protein
MWMKQCLIFSSRRATQVGNGRGANPLWLCGNISAGLGGVPCSQLADQSAVRPARHGTVADAADRGQSAHQGGAALQARRGHKCRRPGTGRQPHGKVIVPIALKSGTFLNYDIS